MSIVCSICKKEVHLVYFGSGFVGTCCDSVVYNSAVKPQLDMKKGEEKIFLCTPHAKKEGILTQNIPSHGGE